MPVKKTTTKKTTTSKKTIHKTKATHKKVSDTPSIDTKKLDSSIDKCMSFLQKKCKFIHDIMVSDVMKSVLSFGIVEDTNKWVKQNLQQISQVFGRLALVFGAISVLMSLGAMGLLYRYFGVGYTILFILNLIYIVVSMVLGFGLIKMKKRVPFFVTFTVLLDIVYLIIASIFWGAWAVSSPRTVIFYVIFMIYIIKNKSLFTK